MFKRNRKLHPIIQRAPLRGQVDRDELGEALCPKTTEQRRQEWKDRFLAANPELTPEDLLNLEAQGLTIISKWRAHRSCAESSESS